ncbi:MAG: signal peptidase I [Oscillospiraceae bacterium]|nr:signal peptidase I [Oscillospiraceae bacterium]
MKAKKVISTICNALGVTILIIVVLAAGALIVLQLMGHMPMAVLSGSMQPSYKEGDLVFIDTNIKPEDLDVGDVIAFHFDEQTIVTHRIVAVEGQSFIVRGDANNVNDATAVTYSAIVGQAWKERIPQLGYLIMNLGTQQGIAAGALLLALLIVLFLVPAFLNPSKKKGKTSKEGAKPPEPPEGEKAAPEAEDEAEDEAELAPPPVQEPDPEDTDAASEPGEEAPPVQLALATQIDAGKISAAGEKRELERKLRVLDKQMAALERMKAVLVDEKIDFLCQIRLLDEGRRQKKTRASDKKIKRIQRRKAPTMDRQSRLTMGRIALLAMAPIMTIALYAGATYAMFTHKTPSASNAMKPGYVQAEVEEDFEGVLTYDHIEKNPSVTNTGSVPSYVRVMLAGALDKFALYYDDGGTYVQGINSLYWEDGGDGYYYYKEILNPGEQTKPLFTHVKLIGGVDIDDYLIPDSSPPEYDLSSFDIAVYAEAVQTNANNDQNLTGAAAAKAAFGNIVP